MGAVIALRREFTGAQGALSAIDRHLDRCALSQHTVRAYKRQCATYVDWLHRHNAEHPDAFQDVVGAEAAVTAWRRQLLHGKAAAATLNQAMTAVALMYENAANIKIAVKMARVQRSKAQALNKAEQGALERASQRSGTRDAAIIAVLLYTGIRVEECTRLDLDDIAITAKTGRLNVVGKGDQPRTVPIPATARERLNAWLLERGREPGPLWIGQRGRLTISGITHRVNTLSIKVGITKPGPHRCRHTFGTRLRQGGADIAQVQALMGHANIETTAIYFQADNNEQTAVIEAVFN